MNAGRARRAAGGPGVLDLIKKLEHWTTLVLIAMLAVVVLLATAELGFTLVRDITAPPVMFPGIERLLELFGRFLLVLIGIELLETMRAFATEHTVRVEVVISVAIIALARKIVVLEPEHVSSTAMFGIAALVAAISLAHLVFVRGRAEAPR
jgi:uncharacterized membrane protein (DUF373 family)